MDVSENIVAPTDKDMSGSTVRLTIHDFTPAHVARKLSVGGGSYPISPSLTGRAISLLDDDVPSEADPDLVSIMITTSSPHMAGQPERLIPEYATESPYPMATRNIQLARASGSFVLHLPRDRLVFVQVRICDASFATLLMTEVSLVICRKRLPEGSMLKRSKNECILHQLSAVL